MTKNQIPTFRSNAPSEADLARCAEVSRAIQALALGAEISNLPDTLTRIEASADLLAHRLESLVAEMLEGDHVL